MSLKNRVLALLRGREAARIRFTVASASVPVTINHATFTAVANAIVAGKIGVKPFVSTEDVLAQYGQPEGPTDPATGQLEIPPILGRIHEGAVLHEGVHAFFDLTSSDILAPEEEAVCAIVSTLYYRMTGLTPVRWLVEPFKSAKVVADALLRQYATGAPRVPAVDADAFRTVLWAVATHRTYWDSPAGLLGPLFFGQPIRYVHDG